MNAKNEASPVKVALDRGRPQPPPTGLRKLLPFLGWLPGYDKKLLGGDVSAGLTTAVMLIPQGMAYSMLAGLPPIMGLYASVVPIAVYALLGSSRQLAVGPVAMVSLLTLQGVQTLAEPGSANFIAYAVTLALMVGVLQIGMGVFKLGFLTNFLSHPVISGFTSAAALIIGASQLKLVVGVDLGKSGNVFAIVGTALSKIGEWHWLTVGFGVGAIVMLEALKHYKKTFPRALAVVVVGTVAAWALGLDQQGLKIVKDVPAGFPTPSLPMVDGAVLEGLLPTAITIAMVGFMESISVAKAFARMNRYEVDAGQELVGLGAANVAGSFFNALPVTGGFSRTAVNAQAGAKTGLASLITAAVIGLTLLFFTPLFYFLPSAVLAAIILTAVAGLVDVAEVKHLWHVKRADLALLALTFVATLGLGIEEGILVGVGASLLNFVVRTTRPHFAVLGRLPGTEEYRNVKNYPEAETTEGVLALRIDAQFYFGNVSFLKDTLRSLELGMKEPLRAVVLEMISVNQLDSSAEAALAELYAAYRERGIPFVLSGVKGPVKVVMQKSGLWEKLGEDARFFRVHDAMLSVAQRVGGREPPALRRAESSAEPVVEAPTVGAPMLAAS